MQREHALQIAAAKMLQLVLDPERTWWTAIDHAAQLSQRYGGMRKARGVKRGLPDILILAHETRHAWPRVIGIELKTETGSVSAPQREVADAWDRLGAVVYVARSLEEVQQILETAGVPMLRRMTFFGGKHERLERASRARHPRAQRPRKSKDPVPLV